MCWNVFQHWFKGVDKQPHEMRWVGPLVLNTIGRILITVGLDKVVEPGVIGVCGDEALPDKRGNSFCRQTFFQVELTLFSNVLTDMRGTW